MSKKNGTYMIQPFWLFVFSNCPAIVRMALACVRGSYRLPYRSLLKIAIGLAYIFFLIDFIPDFLPVAGWIDDLAVSAWLANSLRKDIALFRNWEKSE